LLCGSETGLLIPWPESIALAPQKISGQRCLPKLITDYYLYAAFLIEDEDDDDDENDK